MVVLGCLALLLLLLLPVAAAPNEYGRDIFGLIHGDGNTSTRGIVPNTTLATSTSSLGKPLTTTYQSVASPWSPTPTSQPNSTAATNTSTPVLTPSVLPVSAESLPANHTSKTWQIIGIAIIAVLFIATSITCAMFFDRLWRFLRDVVCCTSRPATSEELISDCETQSWDTSSLGFKGESPREETSVYTRHRELPWNTDTQDWTTLHRQPSRRRDHPPAA